jgi:hypothetical protein
MDIDLGDVTQLADPHLLPALARMRAAEPVYWSKTMGGWFFTAPERTGGDYKRRGRPRPRRAPSSPLDAASGLKRVFRTARSASRNRS